jgi:hypothetical protein
MPRRLKVYQAHLGFFDTVVAAQSQKAALEAWGSRQDLFRDKAASVASDPDAIKTALSKPGVVLKRLAGSNGPYLDQPDVPKVPLPRVKSITADQRKPKLPVAKARKPTPAQNPVLPPDRSRLDAAERRLADLKARQEDVMASFTEQLDALTRDRDRRCREFRTRIAELERTVEVQKRHYGEAERRYRRKSG